MLIYLCVRLYVNVAYLGYIHNIKILFSFVIVLIALRFYGSLADSRSFYRKYSSKASWRSYSLVGYTQAFDLSSICEVCLTDSCLVMVLRKLLMHKHRFPCKFQQRTAKLLLERSGTYAKHFLMAVNSTEFVILSSVKAFYWLNQFILTPSLKLHLLMLTMQTLVK